MTGEPLSDLGKLVGAVMIDLSKAFDSINHQQKLNKYGVHGVELQWFTTYLHHRRQRVLINGISSDWNHIHTGVPHGTILSPLLFTIFVNDLPQFVEHCSINLYADDTTIKTRRQNATLLQVHKCLHKCAPPYLNNKFVTNSNFGYSSTRGGNKLHLKRPN